MHYPDFQGEWQVNMVKLHFTWVIANLDQNGAQNKTSAYIQSSQYQQAIVQHNTCTLEVLLTKY